MYYKHFTRFTDDERVNQIIIRLLEKDETVTKEEIELFVNKVGVHDVYDENETADLVLTLDDDIKYAWYFDSAESRCFQEV